MIAGRKTYAFIIPNLLSDFYMQQWVAIQEEAVKRDIHLIIFCPFLFISESAVLFESKTLFNFIDRNQIDGIVFSTGSFSNYYSLETINTIFKNFEPIPAVSISIPIQGITSIVTDNKKGMKSLANHFIREHGCRRIGFIKGPEDHQEAKQRYDGFCEALLENHISLDKKLLFSGDFGYHAGQQAAEKMVSTGIIPDALLAANDDMILGAMMEFVRNGLHIPKDIALGGFDDSKDSAATSPPLTTVCQLIPKQIRLALDELDSIIQGEGRNHTIEIPAEPVIRRSCGCKEKNKEKQLVETPFHLYDLKYGYNFGLLNEFADRLNSKSDSSIILEGCKQLLGQLNIPSCFIGLYEQNKPLLLPDNEIPASYIHPFFIYADNHIIHENELPEG